MDSLDLDLIVGFGLSGFLRIWIRILGFGLSGFLRIWIKTFLDLDSLDFLGFGSGF